MNPDEPKEPDKQGRGWGGKREGAGRKERGGRTGLRIMIYIKPEENAALRELGNGSVTAGVRRLLHEHQERERT